MKALRAAVIVAVAVLAIVAVRDVLRLGDALPWHQLIDFSDFYCAGTALDNGQNPYFYEPLHQCEHAVNVGSNASAMFFRYNTSVAVPAPQPPFVFLPFMALARMPFDVARIVQAAAIVIAVVICVVALVALGVPALVATAALVLSAGYIELEMGQVVPFALLALVLCGLALARRRDRLAGVLAALTAVAPTVGLPVIVAVFAFVPRARATLVASAAVLAAISLVLVGPYTLFVYFTRVLPSHASAELYFPFQYSLTWLLASLGAPQRVAQVAGTASYVVLSIIGLFVARNIANTLQRRELLAFVPALAALVGGTFLHQEELCFALPALLILTTVTAGKTRVYAAAALCALSIPWLFVWATKELFLATICVCAVLLIGLRIDLRIAVPLLAVLAALIITFEHQPPILWPPLPGTKPIVYAPNELAQDSWLGYVNSLNGIDMRWLYVKIPTWIALLVGLGVAAGVARGSPIIEPLPSTGAT